jgi:hypothetical protein
MRKETEAEAIARLQAESSRKHNERLQHADAEREAEELAPHTDSQSVREIIKICRESLAEIRSLSVQFSSDRALVESMYRYFEVKPISMKDLESSLKKTTKGVIDYYDKQVSFISSITEDTTVAVIERREAELDKQFTTWQRNLIDCLNKNIDVLKQAIKEFEEEGNNEEQVIRARGLIERNKSLISEISNNS